MGEGDLYNYASFILCYFIGLNISSRDINLCETAAKMVNVYKVIINEE